jgi:hypothetical protein
MGTPLTFIYVRFINMAQRNYALEVHMNESTGSETVDETTQHEVAVAVITPSGIYPDEEHLLRSPRDASIESVLEKAKDALKLVHTEDWVAFVGDRSVDIKGTFKSNHLHCLVDIEWHKPEGGGGEGA